jgi:hypothetical protein
MTSYYIRYRAWRLLAIWIIWLLLWPYLLCWKLAKLATRQLRSRTNAAPRQVPLQQVNLGDVFPAEGRWRKSPGQ